MPVKLVPHLARYPWGHPTQVATWLHDPTVGPAAEAWFGTHSLGPTGTETGSTLAELLTHDPGFYLGSARNSLPWLVKLLAASEPLSLQVHPDATTAAARFAAGHASYKDPFAKPEVLVALVPTDALIGFEDTDHVKARAQALGLPEFVELLDLGAAGAAMELWRDRDRSSRLSTRISSAPSRRLGAFAPIVSRWREDPYLAVALCLRLVHLAPGEAVEIPAGLIHAYLSGGGLEVMGASDNVLRGGLTNKPLDVDELLAVLDPAAEPRLLAAPASGRLDLSLLPAQVHHHTGSTPTTHPAPAMVWCQEGPLTLTSVAAMELSAGSAVFLPAAEGEFTLTGGSAWVITN